MIASFSLALPKHFHHLELKLVKSKTSINSNTLVLGCFPLTNRFQIDFNPWQNNFVIHKLRKRGPRDGSRWGSGQAWRDVRNRNRLSEIRSFPHYFQLFDFLRRKHCKKSPPSFSIRRFCVNIDFAWKKSEYRFFSQLQFPNAYGIL